MSPIRTPVPPTLERLTFVYAVCVRSRARCDVPANRSNCGLWVNPVFLEARATCVHKHTHTSCLESEGAFRTRNIYKEAFGVCCACWHQANNTHTESHVVYISLAEGFASPGTIGGSGELLACTCLPFKWLRVDVQIFCTCAVWTQST